MKKSGINGSTAVTINSCSDPRANTILRFNGGSQACSGTDFAGPWLINNRVGSLPDKAIKIPHAQAEIRDTLCCEAVGGSAPKIPEAFCLIP